jgi:hypothetical protein
MTRKMKEIIEIRKIINEFFLLILLLCNNLTSSMV